MKDLPAPQIGFVLYYPNSPKAYTFFCKSLVEKQTWMTELASMVMPLPSTKPANSFIKSASFQTSRPPAQTISNNRGVSGNPQPGSILPYIYSITAISVIVFLF